ncbi:acyltransferase family protein [Denitrificimonas caeni]|uniref:acyltransferase family protein n=1 Tax=Denitrificimonas caeni TaxID=521720 RepID=UPI0003B6A2A5|nr:acyltransferase family protein [Denitrificimonas caeni]
MDNTLVKRMRNDITGLRAIAVIAVVIFHYSRTSLPGGFVGVDVFFVISGFLMTSIIFNGLKGNGFDYVHFVKSRAKRIFPALLVVLLIVLILGYVFIAPAGYKEISKHSLASSLFVSNFVYAGEADYFDTVSEGKFLLHTWSLSLEWQFYLLYPVFIILLSKLFSNKKLKYIILAATLFSFCLSVYLSYANPTSAYFSLYSRAWEMLVGGLVFLFPLKNFESKKARSYLYVIEIIGLLSIVFSFFYINETMPWPGYLSLLPVFGTYLCLLAANKKSLLGNFLFKTIGLWSYSIYLVHWPVLVFSKQLNFNLNIYLYLVVVFFISFLLYEVVEKKRNHGYGVVFLLILSVSVSMFFYNNGGAPNRISDEYKLNKQEITNKYYGAVPFFSQSNGWLFYVNADPGKANLILVGDSYSLQYLRFFNEQEFKTASVARTICMIQPDHLTDKSTDCSDMYGLLLNAIRGNSGSNLVLNQNWNAYVGRLSSKINKEEILSDKYIEVVLSGLDKMVSELSANNNLIIVGTYSYPGYDVWQCLAGRELLGQKIGNECKLYSENNEQPIDEALKNFADKYSNVHFISPRDILCDKNGCLNYVDGIPIHFDGDHLSTVGAELVGNYISSYLRALKSEKAN